MARQARLFARIPTRRDIPAQDLPEWISALHLAGMDIDWVSLEANEKAWMKKWDEQVKGAGSHPATHL
jgi:hypothetical protein